MEVAFFNYLPLEYGGGLANYYLRTAVGLKTHYPDLSCSIITLSEAAAQKFQRLYSLYFLKPQLTPIESSQSIKKSLSGVSYKKATSLAELGDILRKKDRIYAKNDLVELTLLKYFLGPSLPKIIIGFHTPPYYESTASVQSKLHNILYNSFYYRHLLTMGTAYHVLNSFDEKHLKSLVPTQKIVKIYNPFSFSKQSSASQSRSPKSYTVLWAGRLTEQKGVRDLLDVIDKLNHTDLGQKITWRIAGEGELKSTVQQAAKTWKNIRYEGYISPQHMHTFYLSGTIFLSTSHWESLPYTLLEAAGEGLPLIGYTIHGNDEIITPETGIMVSTTDEIVTTITAMLNKPFHPDIIHLRAKFSEAELYPKLYRLLTT